MKRAIMWISGVLLLAGCQPTEEQKQRVKTALPDGCELIDLGQYGEIDRLVVITCNGMATTSANISDSVQQGKVRVKKQYVAVEITP